MLTKCLEAHICYQPPLATINLYGEINALAEKTLNAAYTAIESQAPEIILLNFQHVMYINSTGIALVFGLFARARQSHYRLLVCGLNEHYMEIFHILHLSDIVDIFSEEASALASVYQHVS
jgi:anti-sigma B factor antagonist